MTSEFAVSVFNVSKCYLLYNRPQDRLKQTLLWRFGKNYAREFWALRDISFQMKRGDTLGIVGRNGAGKSTLLQIIAGTLQPTKGQVQVSGRVTALLELGSGFNPEYTGRENVFLNGAILGMSHSETEQLFEQIAAFADIGHFIDQPVKLYSSGMFVRLAFSVQAFVPKEILIVDEALAVGDMFFQAKCMARMKQLLDEGVTVLFVSHNMAAVKSLCRQAILLEEGNVLDYGPADRVIEKYFALQIQSRQPVLSKSAHMASSSPAFDADNSTVWRDIAGNNIAFQKRASFERTQNGKAHFVNVQLLDYTGTEINYVQYGQSVILRMVIEVCVDDITLLSHGYHIRDQNGIDIVYSGSNIEDANIHHARRGDWYVVDWKFDVSLKAGNYNIVAVLGIPIDLSRAQVDFCDFVPLAVQFAVAPRPDAPLHGAVHWNNQVEIQRI